MIFTFDTAGTLGSTAVVTQGATGLDFADAGTGTCTAGTAYTAGATCTVDVNFKPKFAGTRYGAAELLDSSGNVLATGYVQGTGVGPQVNFLPGTEIIIAPDLAWSGGIAVDGSGNVYITDYNQPEDTRELIYKETFSGGSYTLSTIPTNTQEEPGGIAVDGAGDLYVAYGGDLLEANSMILKETPSPGGYIQSIVASSTSSNVSSPFGVAVDGSGNVFFSSSWGAVYKETLTAGSYTQSTVVTGLPSATGVAVDGSGAVYIAVNETNGWVVKETPSAGGYTQSTIAVGNGGVPFGVAVDGSGNVYVAYTDNNGIGQVFKETPTEAGYVQSIIQTSGLNQPMGIAVDGSGNVYIGNSGYYSVLKEDLADPPSLAFATTGVGTDSPQTVTVENVGNAA
jgi:sugar lactone lactonase YvrE